MVTCFPFRRAPLRRSYPQGEGNGVVAQASNDGGIDGVIDQDALGLSKIYVQAKRYGEKFGRPPEAQSFVSAMHRAGNTGHIYYFRLFYIRCTGVCSKSWQRAIPSTD